VITIRESDMQHEVKDPIFQVKYFSDAYYITYWVKLEAVTTGTKKINVLDDLKPYSLVRGRGGRRHVNPLKLFCLSTKLH
jgi:hypothetical protein